MHKLNLKIKEAKIKTINIDFSHEGEPGIRIEVALVLDDGREIGQYFIGTDRWGADKVVVPPNIHPQIRKILDILAVVVIRHANGDMFALGAAKDSHG